LAFNLLTELRVASCELRGLCSTSEREHGVLPKPVWIELASFKTCFGVVYTQKLTKKKTKKLFAQLRPNPPLVLTQMKLATCAVVLSLASGCYFDPGYDYPGGDGVVAGGGVCTDTVQQCCDTCHNYTTCKFFTFKPVGACDKSIGTGAHTCYLKTEMNPSTRGPNPGRSSGGVGPAPVPSPAAPTPKPAAPTPKPAAPTPAPPPSTPLVTKLDAFGSNSIRIRIAVPGQKSVTQPVISALLPSAPPSLDGCGKSASLTDPLTLVNGNLKVALDPSSYYLTATRVSDGKLLLQQTGLTFTQACVGSRPGSKSITASFATNQDERVYGLGEHITGKVMQLPYQKKFSDSLYYGRSHGADVSVPFYTSSVGYGFLWNLPSFGSLKMPGPTLHKDPIVWVSNATLGLDIWITTTAASTTSSTTAPTATTTTASDPPPVPAGTPPATVTPASIDNQIDTPATSISAATPTDETGGKMSTRKRSIYADILHQYADAVGHPIPMPTWSTGFIQVWRTPIGLQAWCILVRRYHTPIIIHNTLIHNTQYTIRAHTIHHTPYTHTPYTIHAHTIHHTPYTRHHTPYIMHHPSCTTHHTLYTNTVQRSVPQPDPAAGSR
jgi:hypothetical protein